MAFRNGTRQPGLIDPPVDRKQLGDLLASADGSMSAGALKDQVARLMNGGSAQAAPKRDKPPLPFDLTDQILQAMRAGEMRKQQIGRTRASAFSLLGGA